MAITFPESGSGSTFVVGKPVSRKDRDFCIKHGLVHAWKAPEYFISTGPHTVQTEYCENCGRQRRWVPGYWEDVSE